ncbi:type II CAAX prenyl endopeptidase Rce1 family protein [Georgenia sp. AZ-5]|uniref:CPBP family glutamic-type intramembrane protease n=1 Tax=Georgenia sp. AZ-5 TaxID=3367526 RepID=UPI0037542A15
MATASAALPGPSGRWPARLVALATGTYHAPDGGWTAEAISYVVMGLLVLGIAGNLAEEMAWGGFVQTRLMDRHGMFAGSMPTAIPFALVHLPLAFAEQDLSAISWSEVALSYGVTVAIAPFMRYALGGALVGTGGSVLAIGLLHASFNASGKLSMVDGWWQYGVALVILALAVAGHRYLKSRRTDDAVAPATA